MKSFALVDCNSFYCSCERVFRPDLWGKPVIVLSNNDGCAIARTSEAKKVGIKMGDPFFKIKNLCSKHNVHIFSSNFSLYTNISDRVMNTLRKNCPDVEVYSVDEAFCDLTGMSNLSEHGHFLKNKIYKDIGVPVGIGIAPTKVLAKVANRIAKTSTKANGVVNIMEPKYQDIALKMTPVEDIWGVGKANSKKLHLLGIHTAYDFKEFKNDRLIQKILTKVGLQIKKELQGTSCFPLNLSIENKKEIMCSRTFGSSILDKESLKQSIASYITNAAEKMRRQSSLCTDISIFARTNPFNNSSQYYMYEKSKLENPTCDTRKLIKLALSLLEVGYRTGYEYKKAGVKLSNFYNSSEYQINFLSPSDSSEDIELMRIIDRINHLEGEGTIKFAACGINAKAWQMNRNYKSPRYTTSWNDLLTFN